MLRRSSKSKFVKQWYYKIFNTGEEVVEYLNALTKKGYQVSHVDVESRPRHGIYEVFFKIEKEKK